MDMGWGEAGRTLLKYSFYMMYLWLLTSSLFPTSLLPPGPLPKRSVLWLSPWIVPCLSRGVCWTSFSLRSLQHHGSCPSTSGHRQPCGPDVPPETVALRSCQLLPSGALQCSGPLRGAATSLCRKGTSPLTTLSDTSLDTHEGQTLNLIEVSVQFARVSSVPSTKRKEFKHSTGINPG